MGFTGFTSPYYLIYKVTQNQSTLLPDEDWQYAVKTLQFTSLYFTIMDKHNLFVIPTYFVLFIAPPDRGHKIH